MWKIQCMGYQQHLFCFQVANLKIKNSELTMKCNKLEQSQIKVYLSKTAQANLNAYGILRSKSEGSYDVPSSPVLKSSMSDEGCKKDEVCIYVSVSIHVHIYLYMYVYMNIHSGRYFLDTYLILLSGLSVLSLR